MFAINNNSNPNSTNRFEDLNNTIGGDYGQSNSQAPKPILLSSPTLGKYADKPNFFPF
jgi:hypothetical protein